MLEPLSKPHTPRHSWQDLAEGYPIVFGLQLFNSFDRHRQPGLVPMPTRREQQRGDGDEGDEDWDDEDDW